MEIPSVALFRCRHDRASIESPIPDRIPIPDETDLDADPGVYLDPEAGQIFGSNFVYQVC